MTVELIGRAAVGTIVMAMAVIVVLVAYGLNTRNIRAGKIACARHLGMQNRGKQDGRGEADQKGHAEARKHPRMLFPIMFHAICLVSALKPVS